MKKHRKLLIFLALVLLVAGYIWQSPSERNTVAILVRRQSQMEDFVQSVKAEAAQPPTSCQPLIRFGPPHRRAPGMTAFTATSRLFPAG